MIPSRWLLVCLVLLLLTDTSVPESGAQQQEEELVRYQASPFQLPVTRKSLEPGEISPVSWDHDGTPVVENFYQIGLPPSLRRELLSYCDRMGISEILQRLFINDQPLPANTSTYEMLQNEKWMIQRPGAEWKSNMHWISPGSPKAQQNFLRVLSAGGFDTVLDTIGKTLGLEHILVYQLTFIAMSRIDKGYVHLDFLQTGKKAFNMIVPLILVEDSGPELNVTDSEEVPIGQLKYTYDTAVMIGDEVYHAPSAVDYDSSNAMRLMATLYVAEVNEANVKGIMSGYTQDYPPLDNPEFLLRQRGVHWGNGRRLPTKITSPSGNRGSKSEL